MFKALINSLIFLFLVILNMALFIWCVNQLDLGQSPLKRRLLNEVQAEANSYYMPKSVQRIEAVTQIPIRSHSTRIVNYATPQNKSNQQIILQFKPEYIRLEKIERTKLNDFLQRLEIKSYHSAEIYSGTTFSERNSKFSQLAKLRLQSVARIIYPYTQTVKMYYRSSKKEEKILVRFFDPQAEKIDN
jgi:hypothetical protein